VIDGVGTIVAVVGGSVVNTGAGAVVCDGPWGVAFMHPEHKRTARRIPMAAEKWVNFMVIFLISVVHLSRLEAAA
jgi:hypothetical protein